MKKFVIINGTEVIVKHFESIEAGIIYCENYLDQSKEIIIREIKEITLTF